MDNTTPTNDSDLQEGESLVQPLAEDNETPFNAADDNGDDMATAVDSTHPITDSATDLDTQELYDEGSAVEASEPNTGNTVTGYNPDEDQRKN